MRLHPLSCRSQFLLGSSLLSESFQLGHYWVEELLLPFLIDVNTHSIDSLINVRFYGDTLPGNTIPNLWQSCNNRLLDVTKCFTFAFRGYQLLSLPYCLIDHLSYLTIGAYS